MAERHGIYVSEVPGSVITPVQQNFTLPVAIGTAPVNLSKASTLPVNVPILCYSYQEAVDAFGYSDDWEDYTLSEVIYSHFQLYKQSPIVLINVLDPAEHKTTVSPAAVTLVDGTATLPEGIVKGTVTVTNTDGSTTYVLDTDYTLSFDATGKLILTAKTGGAITNNASLQIGYDKIDASKVNAADIIGGVDSTTLAATGLELLNQVFPRFRLVPGIVIAPGWSDDPTVAAVMVAKASLINNHFRAQAITDLPSNLQYTEAPAWKEENGYTDPRQFNTYPKVTKSGKVYRLSTHLAGVICRTDTGNAGIPSLSPSNKGMEIDGTLTDDRELALGPEHTEYLNAAGIHTALNFIGGWATRGNRTGAYPAQTDPQSAFIPVRRMMDWIANTVTLTYWRYLDGAINKRLVEAITDSVNIWLNGLTSNGDVLGGRVEFLSEENPPENIMDGKLKFHIYVTPPSPAQVIDFVLEYDASYLAAIAA